MMFTRRECAKKRCTPLNFKQELNCATLHHPTLSQEEIAAKAEIPMRWLSAYANESEPRHIPAKSLVDVIRVTGRIELLDWLARDLGFSLTVIDATPQTRSITDETLDVAAEAGRVVALVQDAKRDGTIDAHDAAAIRPVLNDLRRQTDELDRALPTHEPLRAVR